MVLPSVSVIIPTYNRAEFVKEAIDSAFSQTFRDYEVIVIDDGSTDNTQEVLQEYGNRIKHLHQINSGVGAARNAGIRLAEGEWLAFLDSDDIWKPEYLSCQIERAKQNPSVCTHMTNSIRVEADGATIDTFQSAGVDAQRAFKNDSCLILERPLAFILQKPLPYLQATMFRREAFIKAGLFNENVTITEDFDVIARMCLQGPLSICNRPLAHIIRRKESIKNLGSVWYSNNYYSRECLGRLYEKLKTQRNLTFFEKCIVNKTLGSNKKAIGNLYWADGEMQKARHCYWEAVFLYPSLKSLLKVIVSYLPNKIALTFAGFSDR